jgi:hypothetical protein
MIASGLNKQALESLNALTIGSRGAIGRETPTPCELHGGDSAKGRSRLGQSKLERTSSTSPFLAGGGSGYVTPPAPLRKYTLSEGEHAPIQLVERITNGADWVGHRWISLMDGERRPQAQTGTIQGRPVLTVSPLDYTTRGIEMPPR